MEELYFRRRCHASQLPQVIFVSLVIVIVGALLWAEVPLWLSIALLRTAAYVAMLAWGLGAACGAGLVLTYCTSKGRVGRPSLLTCRLQTSAAILAGFALLCLLKFGLVVAVSAPLASPGLDVAAWIAADYFPLAGAFMLCTHYVVQTYLFWISITVGLRLSLAPGMLLIVLSSVLDFSQPRGPRTRVPQFRDIKRLL